MNRADRMRWVVAHLSQLGTASRAAEGAKRDLATLERHAPEAIPPLLRRVADAADAYANTLREDADRLEADSPQK